MGEVMAYIGGLFDGEGCVGFGYQRASAFVPSLAISNTFHPVLNAVRDVFKTGTVNYNNYLITGMKNIRRVLLQLLPYLWIKENEAGLMLMYVDSRIHRGRNRSYSVEELECIIEIAKAHNSNPKALYHIAAEQKLESLIQLRGENVIYSYGDI